MTVETRTRHPHYYTQRQEKEKEKERRWAISIFPIKRLHSAGHRTNITVSRSM